MARGRWRPALAGLNQALALSPSNAVVHFRLGVVYSHLDEFEKSTEHMQTALNLNRGEISNDLRRESQFMLEVIKASARITSGKPGSLGKLEKLAEADNAAAQFALAKTLFEARPPRNEEGMRWLLKAAEHGNHLAQFNYAKNLLLIRGENASEEAIEWLTRSAKQGYVEAQYGLGLILYEGKLAPRDRVTADRTDTRLHPWERNCSSLRNSSGCFAELHRLRNARMCFPPDYSG